MISDPDAAGLGLLVQYAMDMYTGPGGKAVVTPPPDERLTPDWNLLGYVTGNDVILRHGQQLGIGDVVFYGYLAQSKNDARQFVVVIRGTQGILEWIDDAQFVQVPHPLGGNVEQGFFRIYQSMKLLPVLGGDGTDAWSGIAAVVNASSVTVVGHSLGSTLATYLTLDLATTAKLGPRVSACLFASPRPGDGDFAKTFRANVSAYKVFNYALDAVPHVPLGLGYASLPGITEISPSEAQARIRFDLACHHHVICYCAMLDYALLNWSQVPQQDQPCSACIRGQNG